MHFGIKGSFILEIVDYSTKQVVQRSPVKRNLILTQGLNYVGAYSFAQNMAYCAIGSGTLAPLLSDTGLAGEIQRTNKADLTLANACLTSLVGNVYSLTKTFAFPVETYPVVIGEIGWSPSATAGNNLFSKSLVLDSNGNLGPIVVSTGQFVRVKYTLQITLSPITQQTISTSNITGWASASGKYCLQYVGLQNIGADGSIGYYDAAQDCNEPSSSPECFIGQNSAALNAFGSSPDRSGSTHYTSPTFVINALAGSLTKKASFGLDNANDTLLRSAGLGKAGSSSQYSGFAYVYDSAQTKTSDKILTLTFLYTWG